MNEPHHDPEHHPAGDRDGVRDHLRRLLDHGWLVRGTQAGGLGLRCYETSEAVDALEIPQHGDCVAWRTVTDAHGDHVVWRHRGSLAACIRAVLALPDPDQQPPSQADDTPPEAES